MDLPDTLCARCGKPLHPGSMLADHRGRNVCPACCPVKHTIPGTHGKVGQTIGMDDGMDKYGKVADYWS